MEKLSYSKAPAFRLPRNMMAIKYAVRETLSPLSAPFTHRYPCLTTYVVRSGLAKEQMW